MVNGQKTSIIQSKEGSLVVITVVCALFSLTVRYYSQIMGNILLFSLRLPPYVSNITIVLDAISCIPLRVDRPPTNYVLNSVSLAS